MEIGRRGTDHCRSGFDQVLLNYLYAEWRNYFSGLGNAFVVRFMLAAASALTVVGEATPVMTSAQHVDVTLSAAAH